MARLTTHVLDTALGRPAADLNIELFRIGSGEERIAGARTNADGRPDNPILEGEALTPGTYELRFHAGDYWRRVGRAPVPLFLDIVPIRFGIAAGEEHYHVPLLLSPFGYSTYRGS